MKLRYFNLVCLTIINLHFEYVSSINRAYDYFRILFDNQEILKPHDIDLIDFIKNTPVLMLSHMFLKNKLLKKK